MIGFRKGQSVSVPCLPLEDRGHIAVFFGPLARFYAGTYESGLGSYLHSIAAGLNRENERIPRSLLQGSSIPIDGSS